MVNLGPERWAEQQIKKASKVLVFLSPRLLRLCGTEEDETQYSSQVLSYNFFTLQKYAFELLEEVK